MDRYLVLASCVLALASLMSAQEPKVLAPHKPVPPVSQYPKQWPKQATVRSLVGGLWMTDANFKSSIYLRNNNNTDGISVTPILWLSNGTKYVLPDVKLEPSGIAVVSVNDALRTQGIAPYATLSGYVEIQFSSFYDPICAVVNNVDTVHSLIFTSTLRPLSRLTHTPEAGVQQHEVEGMWWKEEPTVTGFVALSNITGQPIQATVQVSDSTSKHVGEHVTVVSPHGTKIVNLQELETTPGSNGGIRVLYAGPEDGMMVNGHLQDSSTGYSAAMPFRTAPDVAEKSMSTSFSELGLMTGAADPMMSFPVGTEFTPFSVIRNIASEAVTVRPNIWWMQGGKPMSAQLQWISLGPFQTLDLNLKSLLSNAGLGEFNGSVNLIIDLKGKPHSLLMAGGSVDRSKTYVFQVLPRAIEETASKSISYWSTGNGDDTMVTMWNPADEAQDFTFTLFYPGGQYDLAVHLDPRATRAFNVSEVIQNQIPDAHGNVIPAAVHEGSARIAGVQSERQHILAAIDAGTYNVRKATCSYYCIECDGYVDAFIGIAPFGVKIGGTYQLDVYAYWDGGSKTSLGTGSSWSSSKTSVATVSGGKVTGVAAGSAVITGTADDEPIYWDDCAYDPICYSQDQNMGGSGNGQTGPYQVEPISTASQGPASCTTKGQAGWIRNVTNQVQQVDGSAYAVDGLSVSDQITVGSQNQLGIAGTQTGSATTTGDGSFPDTYYVCSAACPGSGTTGALQNWTVAGIPLFHVNGVTYKCSSITIDGH